jgi:hypothetical protein
MVMPEDQAADAPDQRAMAPDEGLERRLVPSNGKSFQQFSIQQSTRESRLE